MHIISMTLQEKNTLQKVQIFWSEFLGYPLGVCQTEKGISHIHFIDSQRDFLQYIADFFPNAQITKGSDVIVSDICTDTLHIFATDFQLRVFQELSHIPTGETRNYVEIAKNIGQPRAYRAVGTAI